MGGRLPHWTPEVVCEVPNARPRCLASGAGRVWLGLEGSLHRGGHAVIELDESSLATVDTHPAPYLVCSIAVANGALWMGLGPGHLFVMPKPADRTDRRLHSQRVGMPLLAVNGPRVMIGRRMGGFGVFFEPWVDGLKKPLIQIAYSETLLFAAYQDGKVRVFDRATQKRRSVWPDGCSIAVRGDRVAVSSEAGALTIRELPGGQVVTRAQVPRTGIYRFQVRAAPGGWVVFDTGGVQVCDDDGVVVGAWKADGAGRVSDVLVTDSGVFVAWADRPACTGRLLLFRWAF